VYLHGGELGEDAALAETRLTADNTQCAATVICCAESARERGAFARAADECPAFDPSLLSGQVSISVVVWPVEGAGY
jgi:hypothetical protein